jgi:hypothetical protein
MTKTASDFASIDSKLAILLNLNAYLIAKGMTVAQGAPILRRLGLSAPEIAAIFDSTAKAVNVRITEAKKKGKRRGGKGTSQTKRSKLHTKGNKPKKTR